MAANASDLCLASQVASDLGISTSATIDRLVTAASKALARHCARTFEKATGIVENVAGYNRPWLIVDRAPILSITSITIGGTTIDSSEYESYGTAADAGMIYRKLSNWPSDARWTGDITRTPEFTLPDTTNGIVVTYAGGYVTPGQVALGGTPPVTVPEDLQEAAIMVATSLYRSLGLDRNLAAESLGDWSVTYRDALPGILAPEVRSMIEPFVRLRVS